MIIDLGITTRVHYFMGRVMVFNVTFNNISVISWRPVLLVEETGVPGDNHRLVASHWQTCSHNVVSSTHRMSVSGDILFYVIFSDISFLYFEKTFYSLGDKPVVVGCQFGTLCWVKSMILVSEELVILGVTWQNKRFWKHPLHPILAVTIWIPLIDPSQWRLHTHILNCL